LEKGQIPKLSFFQGHRPNSLITYTGQLGSGGFPTGPFAPIAGLSPPLGPKD